MLTTMANKHALPNGCAYSMSVHPTNWKTAKANVNSIWYLKYRFYEPDRKPMQVLIRGMNEYKDLKEKQHVTQCLLNDEIDTLKSGYNPNRKEIVGANNQPFDVLPHTPLKDALNIALQKIKVGVNTRKDISRTLVHIQKAIKQLHFDSLPIEKFERKHAALTLEKCESNNPRFTNTTYNNYRKYISILCTPLITFQALKYNPIDKFLPKRKTVKKIREVLTLQQRIIVDKHLRDKYYTFWRFLQIFYHSGSRETELIQVQKKHVDLDNQRYQITIRKGKHHEEVWKIITDEAVPLWKEVCRQAGSNDYLFSKGLGPGPIPIKSYQITKRWNRLVKKKLGITADFYSLKHVKSTAVSQALSNKEAAKLNSHKNEGMVVKIYDTEFKQRQDDELKRIRTPFV